MEILDLYDSDLKLTGQTIERGKRIPQGLLIPIVAVYVYNDKGAIPYPEGGTAQGQLLFHHGRSRAKWRARLRPGHVA